MLSRTGKRGTADITLVEGECRDVLRQCPSGLFDAIIADPGVGASDAMDGWSKGVPGPTFWEEFLRVVKPGAHMAVFSGRKTNHRLLTYAEDAGWEVRDMLLWLYPKGMPMSLDVGQGVDKKQGGPGQPYFRTIGSMPDDQRQRWLQDMGHNQWWGWGTELRPSWEPIAILRAPLSEGSVAANIIEHGTGAMNIDASRINSGERDAIATNIPDGQGSAHGLKLQKDMEVVGTTTLGRWPSNVIISHHEDCGPETETDGGCVAGCTVPQLDKMGTSRTPPSRFFWCPKTARSERDVGVGHKGNAHKVVRPLALMEWLYGLLVPENGLVLDPFAGTCSTGLAAVRLAPARCVLVEWDPHWVEIGRRRLLGLE